MILAFNRLSYSFTTVESLLWHSSSSINKGLEGPATWTPAFITYYIRESHHGLFISFR